ncbi:hypothetical protein G6L59_24890 [Agrobacterium tumefaciens]|nr:hypothetical protein [Agrobacterium tumefaciens]SCY79904.1 hypothetical protein SAMN03159288_04322 [Rhizobium sp. NFACC06-2]AYM07068.1 hypothetical protein At1D1460_28260 [Agrobacterium tumefaciens]NSZ35631.1 hypothetical protein [Agrobacterium tumefaciens]QLG23571.1 hypothetical protein EML4_14250 [Agrobacterium tumefaciens]UXS89117.1 hypothetical protein FY144_23255 [Agrobacterium tumefaciens]
MKSDRPGHGVTIERNPRHTKHDADTYGLSREEAAGARHGAGWWVSIRRRGHRIVRLFKDSIYGSGDEAYRQARAYRDAVILAIPPATNLEQAVLVRKNNRSGISGVRRVETTDGDVWQATLMTNEGQKRENFSVAKLGDEAAKSMAITQRRKWLRALPVTHLAYAHHAAEVARTQFGDGLAPADDVLPEVRLADADIEARIKEINDQFDASRPKRLRVRVKSYSKDRVSIAVSDGESPARKKLMHLNRRGKTGTEIIDAINRTVRETVTAIYDDKIACWFSSTYGDKLLNPQTFNIDEGFNLLVIVPEDSSSRVTRRPDQYP